MTFLDYVKITQGTASTSRFSNGNTLPQTKRPFGMSSFVPQTRWEQNFYHPSDRSIEGVRLTHQPSPWVGDFASFLLIPQAGIPYSMKDNIWSGYRPEKAVLTPAYQNIGFLRARATFELAPTDHGAKIRIQYDPSTKLPRLAIRPMDAFTKISFDPKTNRIEGYTKHSTHPVPDNFALYFVMDIDGAVDSVMATNNDGSHKPSLENEGIGAGLNIAFKTHDVEFRLGLSFISLEQASYNLETEIGSKSLEEIREEGEKVWEEHLSLIEIETTDIKILETFYSCMYRLFLFPTRMDETNPNGERVHYSPYDGQVHPGPAYTNNGFWDTFRTVYPLYSIICPERYADILEGYVNAYREGGWLPKWPSPAETGIMPGTLIDAVIADAAVKGIASQEVLETALEGAIKHATTVADRPALGRRGVLEYLELGYVPSDKYQESVNRSLDYIYGDFCIAVTAEKLGRTDIKDRFLKKADNYKKLFDKETGFIRGRHEDGTFPEDFDPFTWGNEYTEGSAWQNSLAVYHDIDGLIELMGGKDQFISHLDTLFNTPPFYNIGSYWAEIHEMTEMAAIDFGQFAISNQPSFHIPYLYAVAGEKEKAIFWLERAVNELFTAEVDGFPGDEDNGSMAGWYIFTVMGLYPICPGKAEYVVTKPLVDKITINAKTILSPHIKGVLVNEKLVTDSYLAHSELI